MLALIIQLQLIDMVIVLSSDYSCSSIGSEGGNLCNETATNELRKLSIENEESSATIRYNSAFHFALPLSCFGQYQ